jgi:hypothetical protein
VPDAGEYSQTLPDADECRHTLPDADECRHIYLILMIATMTMAWLAIAQVLKSATRVNLKQTKK